VCEARGLLKLKPRFSKFFLFFFWYGDARTLIVNEHPPSIRETIKTTAFSLDFLQNGHEKFTFIFIQKVEVFEKLSVPNGLRMNVLILKNKDLETKQQ